LKLTKSSGRIEYKGNYYLKQFYGNFPVEKDKYISFYELSKNSNFIFPKPIEIDDVNKTIKLKSISNIESIRNAYFATMKAKNIDPWQIKKFHQVGISLAEIHKGLSLKSSSTWVPSKIFYNALKDRISYDFKKKLDPVTKAHLHGDFSFSNIFFKKGDNNNPVILDPSFDGYTIFSTNAIGPVYIDIAHFVACLDGLVPLRHYPYMQWRRLAHIKDIFISGYEKGSGLALNRELISWLAFATVSSKFEKRFPVFGRIGLWLVYNRFKGNTPNSRGRK